MSQEDFRKIIDNARQILVGKLPNPQDQIDAITYALMYKFMSDIDDQSASLPGGKRTYFAGDYEKYNWHNLMRADGQDQLILYREAIERMSKNSSLPALFREIFNGAMLKFNDPRTLRLFLKEMDAFVHGNSDSLGDAYEYLLSLMGSQGGLGQFRTPRHIIKFIVDVVDPDKTDKILDPAAGTAGFLIEAYSHILRKHDGIGKNGEPNNEKRLTSAELDKIHENFRGFDIDATMIRTSRVNMYLHGFKTPDIIEHDSLTSEDYWSDKYDVILANPPFMTPKGGIQPHKKFGVRANRAEVLFVDYIASHLKPGGKAGIVVPEGIIFQGGTAYKQLRKNLVDNSLIAVISLPAGVFQPYSGVKTSVLVLDNQIAKEQHSVLFVNVKNDGFSIGTQRRTTDTNDLPEALEAINQFKKSGSIPNSIKLTAHLVAKSDIIDSGDYNLSGDKYAITSELTTNFPLVELGDEQYFKIESGGTPSSKDESYWNGNILWATLVDLPATNRLTIIKNTERKITELGLKKSSAKLLPPNTVIISSRATIGRVALNDVPTATNQGFKNIIVKDVNTVDPYYLAYIATAMTDKFKSIATGGTFTEFSKSSLAKIKIPLPPIEMQRNIVAKIDEKQQAIGHARGVIKALERERRYFDPRPLALKNNWPILKLSEICKELFAGGDAPRDSMSDVRTDKFNVPIYSNGLGDKSLYGYTDKSRVNENAVTISARGTIGYPTFRKAPFFPIVRLVVAIPNTDVISAEYLQLALTSLDIIGNGNSIQQLTVPMIKNVDVTIPPLEVQKRIVQEFADQDRWLEASKNTIDYMERAINQALSELWYT